LGTQIEINNIFAMNRIGDSDAIEGGSSMTLGAEYKKVNEDDCKVLLEGQGGDDIAAGYKYVFPLHILDLMKKFRIIKSCEEIYCFTQEEDLSLNQFFNFFMNSIKGYFFGGISADGTKSYQSEILKVNNNDNKYLYKKILVKLEKNKTLL
jgi:hypothetical protein